MVKPAVSAIKKIRFSTYPCGIFELLMADSWSPFGSRTDLLTRFLISAGIS